MDYQTFIIMNGSDYPTNDYLDGNCPSCNEWMAPISFEELLELSNKKTIHKGTSKKTLDKEAIYHREVWYECFECPRCNYRFSVPFSSV